MVKSQIKVDIGEYGQIDMRVAFGAILITKDKKMIPFGVMLGSRDASNTFTFYGSVNDDYLKECGFDPEKEVIENNYILLKPITSHECPMGRPHFNIVGEDGEVFTEYDLYDGIYNCGSPRTNESD